MIKHQVKSYSIRPIKIIKILSLKILTKLSLDMRSYELRDYFSWPSSSHIQYFALFYFYFNQFIRIIEKSNEYQSIILGYSTNTHTSESYVHKLS